MNEKGEKVYWINDMDQPVSMEDILTGAAELPDNFQVDTHMGDPNAAEVPRPDLVERVSPPTRDPALPRPPCSSLTRAFVLEPSTPPPAVPF